MKGWALKIDLFTFIKTNPMFMFMTSTFRARKSEPMFMFMTSTFRARKSEPMFMFMFRTSVKYIP